MSEHSGHTRVCVVCQRPTTSTVAGHEGDRDGVVCDDCQYWSDGNVGVRCANTRHDHTTTQGGNGGELDHAIPMVCADDGLPAHYDTVIGDYQHDDPTAANCFLITHRAAGTPCTLEPGRPA